MVARVGRWGKGMPAQQPRMAIWAQNRSAMVFVMKISYKCIHVSRMPGVVDKHGTPSLQQTAVCCFQSFCCCWRPAGILLLL